MRQVYLVHGSNTDYLFGVHSTEELAHAVLVKLAEFKISDRRK